MANQYPTVVPAGFAGNIFDFNKAKIDRSGAVRLYKGSVSVPSGTASGSKIGLVPVRKGAYLVNSASMIFPDILDTSNTITFSAGVTYNPNSAQTEAPATYIAAGATTLRTTGNGLSVFNTVEAGLNYLVLDDGWITLTTAAAATNQLGNVNFNLAIAYDQGALA
jgi:hypothetical protein